MTLAHAVGAGGLEELLALTVAVLATVLPAAAYLAGTHRLRVRLGRPWGGWRTASFLVGTALVGLSLSPTLEHLAETDARGHMVQHLVLGMYAPLALVLGAPFTLVLAVASVPARRQVRALLGSRPVRFLSHVATAAALDVGGLFLIHATTLYAFTERHELAHGLVHLHVLVAGYLFAWGVAGPDPAPGRPRMGTRIAVLVIASGLHGFLAKLLYARAGAWPPGASWTGPETASAAQLMYYGGHLAEALLLVALFRAWYRRRARLGAALSTAGTSRTGIAASWRRGIAPGQTTHSG